MNNLLCMVIGVIAYLIPFLFFLYGLFIWHRQNIGSLTNKPIVVQYGLPKDFRPAMAQVLLKGKLDNRAIMATLVDLALNGYIKITSERVPRRIPAILLLALKVFFPLFFFFLVFLLIHPIFSLFVAFIFILIILDQFFSHYSQMAFRIEKIKDFSNDKHKLLAYEEFLLDWLFVNRDYFSTYDWRKNARLLLSVGGYFSVFKKKVYHETAFLTEAYDVSIVNRPKYIKVIMSLFIFILLHAVFSPTILFLLSEYLIYSLVVLILLLVTSLVLFKLFFAFCPRLNNKGWELKREILGFIQYLKTVEEERIKVLPAETLNEIIPFAVVFMLEQKWASAFFDVGHAEFLGDLNFNFY